MKKLSIASLIKSLLDFTFPQGTKNQALYLCFSYKKDDKENYIHVVIHMGGAEEIEDVVTVLAYTQHGVMPENVTMNIITHGNRLHKAEFIKALTAATFLPKEGLHLDFIRKVKFQFILPRLDTALVSFEYGAIKQLK